MRIGQYSAGDEQPWCGARTDNGTIVSLPDAGAAAGLDLPRDTRQLVDEWEWQPKAELAVEHATETGVGAYDPEAVAPAAPVSNPSKIVRVGLNYVDRPDGQAESGVRRAPLFRRDRRRLRAAPRGLPRGGP